jgi:hypothetical protein
MATDNVAHKLPGLLLQLKILPWLTCSSLILDIFFIIKLTFLSL